MRDGFTRKVETPERDLRFEDFAARWKATVVVLSGDGAGTERVLDLPQTSIGRGPGCDWSLDDETMSKEHATVEFTAGGFRLRDLGSMNGMSVNGSESKAANLENGDRFRLGDHEFQYVLEERSQAPRTWVLPDA